MRFIHAADLHIDSPLQGLDGYEGAPVERLRGATRQALVALVDLALERTVDLVLLAGDVYDGNWVDFRTGLFFREQMLRLTRAGTRVFVVKGNHDAASQITRQLPPIDGVHEFSSSRSETVDLPELGVAIHGRSFPNRAVPEDLVPSYPAPVPGRFNIGLLHTSLTGREGHDPYAPTSVDALADKGYDYFALGHVHAREVVQESAPRIVFPGNLQGRHARETGPKGCELVTVEGATLVSAEFLALDVVRWHQLHLDASALDGLDALARCFRTQAAALAEGTRDRLHALRVLLHGESPLHRIEAGQPGTLAAAIQAAALDLDDAEVWIEEVRLDLRSPMDRAAVAARTDAVGEVVRLVDALASDEAQLAAWFRARLSELGTLPGAMAGADPAQLDAAAIRALLADAEATVLARLSDTQPGGGA
ncbi:metallophosphoesterase family protein [Quisquiliibacterium transsilvanicum]|uniref:DNA repair exonuclease SbcCD nuclease subunit n=1 Tax=Quisquiliibacterium transsilvanicum TaxID=1549638 RepID=A0A7W8HEA9_9BURK|nr:DNA repair exonuclease [Quisquiliibacterium transsilvanicum]MBB5270380.1 DNA repair exonuclease SbcCD nuclease subunit [Quisquiliibacterium transsilvanicum]